MNMEKVQRGESPVNTLFEYEIINDSEIVIDLSHFKDTLDHLQKVKNSIIYAIILFSKNKSDKILKKINFRSDDNTRLRDAFLPLIFNHSKYFNLTYTPDYEKKVYELPPDWRKHLKKIKNMDEEIKKIKEEIISCKVEGSEDLMYYKPVSNNPLQIRYMGYQIGKWNTTQKKITPVNNKNEENFCKHVAALIKKRSKSLKGKEYDNKEEHYLESLILNKILKNDFSLGDYKISSIFNNCKVCFQFPVLMKPGKPNRSENNSPKYLDILAKSGNRPVIMELKVWSKKKNGRGEYMFSAFSQVLSYYNYLNSVFGKNRSSKGKEEGLEELFELDWERPIIYVIINNIGEDDLSYKFRDYIGYIKKYIQSNIDLKFIEIDDKEWKESREIIEIKRD